MVFRWVHGHLVLKPKGKARLGGLMPVIPAAIEPKAEGFGELKASLDYHSKFKSSLG